MKSSPKFLIMALTSFVLLSCTTSSIEESKVKQLTSEQIQSVFDKNTALIFNVYKEALKRQPSLSGRISLNIKAIPKKKNTCQAESTTVDLEEVALKICHIVESLNFGDGFKEFTYPLEFSPI
ncbi:hypothetical protein [Pleionea litopenaei]|uniref:Uncharacterized protein n=1 Tax=Pleionea litopenaei TaxID=3070815 RepID=A0AA51X956_9GAMM|nr:hypothetical protein [Pleionea sp. HL-JVS1]WMS88825.1 hypothetical protein Q9312_07875 [Pleionea sp. HL-JVS1]